MVTVVLWAGALLGWLSWACFAHFAASRGEFPFAQRLIVGAFLVLVPLFPLLEGPSLVAYKFAGASLATAVVFVFGLLDRRWRRSQKQ